MKAPLHRAVAPTALTALALLAALVALVAWPHGSRASAHALAPARVAGHVTRRTVLRAALPTGAIRHVFVIELENEGESASFGPGSPATYLNGVLRRRGELLAHYFATGHVSLDNYIAQISGQAPTDETGADCLSRSTNLNTLVGSYVNVTPGTLAPDQRRYPGQVTGHGCIYPRSVQTIANQLDRLHPPSPRTHLADWRAYAEDMGNQPTGRELGARDPMGGLDCAHPAVGGVDDTNKAVPAAAGHPADQYASRHNGFVYFHSIIDDRPVCDANVVPLGTAKIGASSRLGATRLADTFRGHLVDDLRHVATTPAFGWITPNLCDDGHDSTCAGPNTIGQTGPGAGGLHGADEFLRHWVPLLLASPAYRSGSMLVVITFDEGALGAVSDGSACCGERPGPSDPTPGLSPLIGPVLTGSGVAPPTATAGGGVVGALLLNSRYVKPGSTDRAGYYNHYSALRSYEDLLGIDAGGVDGEGHLGFAAATGLRPFGADVFNTAAARRARRLGRPAS